MARILGSQGSWVICQMAYQPQTGEMERTRGRISDLATHLDSENYTKGANNSKASATAQDLNSRRERQKAQVRSSRSPSLVTRTFTDFWGLRI